MTIESYLRTDLLPATLTTERVKVQIIAETQFNEIVRNSEDNRSTTPMAAKNINETMELILDAINHYQEREEKTQDARVIVSYEEPDEEATLEKITITIEDRDAGIYGQGAPLQGKVRNLKPILREVKDDPDAPGYKLAILGYWYDNILGLTCWARTNKAANARALWLENLMEEYNWFFRLSGVSRILYQGRGKDRTKSFSNNIFYGRPVLYYVKTENIRALRQKTLEQIYIRYAQDTTLTTS